MATDRGLWVVAGNELCMCKSDVPVGIGSGNDFPSISQTNLLVPIVRLRSPAITSNPSHVCLSPPHHPLPLELSPLSPSSLSTLSDPSFLSTFHALQQQKLLKRSFRSALSFANRSSCVRHPVFYTN